MGAGYHGGFGNTKGSKSYKYKSLHKDRQGKHIIGHKNYTVRSIFSGSLSEAQTLIKKHAGSGIKLSGNKERIDFGRQIGYYVDQSTGLKLPTTIGIIHYSKDGAHIVPCRPKEK